MDHVYEDRSCHTSPPIFHDMENLDPEPTLRDIFYANTDMDNVGAAYSISDNLNANTDSIGSANIRFHPSSSSSPLNKKKFYPVNPRTPPSAKRKKIQIRNQKGD